jgi:antitoxin YefM
VLGQSLVITSGVPDTVAASGDLAIVVAMTAAEHLPLADVKNRLSEVVERLEREHGRVVITKHGRPAAVVLSIADLEGLEETLEILSDRPLMTRVKKAAKEIDAGTSRRQTKDEALNLITRA